MKKFEEEIARINEECNGQIAPINERMEQLKTKNKEMRQLREINNDEIKVLAAQKASIVEECSQKKQELYKAAGDYYAINMSSKKLRFLLHGFLAEHDDINALWNAYVSANFPAAQENEMSMVKGGAA